LSERELQEQLDAVSVISRVFERTVATMESPPLERKLVAILAADAEGYSRLMHENEEATLATLTSHRQTIDALIASGRGVLSNSAGDSILAEFASVVDALDTAVAIQQAMSRANKNLVAERRMLFRIGINVGDVMVKDGGIFGDGVNVAARLEGLADPGGICVTRGVRDHLRDRMEYTFRDLGEHSVKNIARPVRAFRVVFDHDGSNVLTLTEPARSKQVAADKPRLEPDPVELAFWESVQASDDQGEYGEYLRQFPDGAFAGLARSRLEKPVASDPTIELAFWDSVKDANDPQALEAYLEKFPNGEFKDLAELRLKSGAPKA